MSYFRDVHYMNSDIWVRYSISGDKPDDVEKHYMVSPDDSTGLYVPEITSYKDLQKFSMRGQSCIGREKPVYHLKEIIPPVMDTAYDPHPGKAVTSYYYVCSWWPQVAGASPSAYYVTGHGNGYEDFTFYTENRDGKVMYTSSFRGEVCKPVKQGSRWRYAMTSLSYLPGSWYTGEGSNADLARAKSAELYAMAEAIFEDCETVEDIYALPQYQQGTVWIYSDSDLSRYFYQGGWKTEADLFNPKEDLKLVSQQHTIPVGLEPRLCAEAVSQTSFNTNSIANGLELFDTAVNIYKAITQHDPSFLINWKSGKKAAADAWLKYRYVYCTTKSDMNEIVRYASKGDPTVCRAGDTVDSGTMHVKIKLQPKSNQLGKMVDRLTSQGLAPNAYNMWDLVPFSFVVDWFVGIGDFLEEINQYGRCAAFDVMSVTSSWTWEDYIVKGQTKAKFVFYERTVSPSFPAYVPYVESRSASGETILKRCADTVALIGG